MSSVATRTFGAILLIAGTCIGAGMLGLPIATAASGFLGSLILIIISAFCMWLSGLHTLEANLALPDGSNFISMTRTILGRSGEIITLIVYAVLLYSLIAAYLAAGGSLLRGAIAQLWKIDIPHWLGPLPWMMVAATLIFIGVKSVDGFNRLLMLGLVAAYIALVAVTSSHIQAQYLMGFTSDHLWQGLPVIVASFGFNIILPSLRSYLQGQVQPLSRAIFWGSVIPLIVYVMWQLEVFGTLGTTGPQGLLTIAQAQGSGGAIIRALQTVTQNTWVVDSARFFAFFAIASSFLGVTFSLSDFIADGLRLHKNIRGKIVILVLTFIPPLLYAEYYPRGFILALSYAGVAVGILQGIIPALMVWIMRRRKVSVTYRAPFGRLGLIALMVFGVILIISQVMVAA